MLAGQGKAESTRALIGRALHSLQGSARAAKKGGKGPSQIASLADKRTAESSGVAASAKTPGLIWTHNDSGDGPYLYATDRKGRAIARFTVTGAKNVDWEDMALGIGADGAPCIYLSDSGDNGHDRHNCCVYQVPEPDVDMTLTGQDRSTMIARRYPFEYPDGRHDSEAMLVHPTTGELLIVTKVESGKSGVYRFPMPLQRDTKVVLEKVGTVVFTNALVFRDRAVGKLATGGAVAPDGKHAAIRTYTDVLEWTSKPGQTIAEALRGKPRTIEAPWLGQFEALCYTPDGKALLTTSEGSPTPLWEVPR